MNKQLIEKEIQKRVGFRLNEIENQFHMHKVAAKLADKHSFGHIQCRAYLRAWEDMHEILNKELTMGTPFDGTAEKRVWEMKELVVDKLSDRLLKKGTREYDRNKSFINNIIETNIFP